ncbi:glycosyltransferase [Hydrogenimonas sp.]
MNQPLVSIYIPTHNRKDRLRRAIESALNQTYKKIEVIVADDASSDGTSEIMKDWCQKEPRLRYIRLEKPSGANIARNEAIRAAKGDYVTGLDDDDEMVPGRIEKLLKAYRPDLAFVSSRYFIQEEGKKSVKRLTFKRYIIKEDLLYTNIVGNQVFTSREKFLKAGLFDETLYAAQDVDMWVRLLDGCKYAKIVSEPLLVVNVSSSGTITSSARKRVGYWQFYRKHKSSMSKSHRSYRLFGMLLETCPHPKRLWKLIPGDCSFYSFISFGKWIKYLKKSR